MKHKTTKRITQTPPIYGVVPVSSTSHRKQRVHRSVLAIRNSVCIGFLAINTAKGCYPKFGIDGHILYTYLYCRLKKMDPNNSLET